MCVVARATRLHSVNKSLQHSGRQKIVCGDQTAINDQLLSLTVAKLPSVQRLLCVNRTVARLKHVITDAASLTWYNKFIKVHTLQRRKVSK